MIKATWRLLNLDFSIQWGWNEWLSKLGTVLRDIISGDHDLEAGSDASLKGSDPSSATGSGWLNLQSTPYAQEPLRM